MQCCVVNGERDSQSVIVHSADYRMALVLGCSKIKAQLAVLNLFHAQVDGGVALPLHCTKVIKTRQCISEMTKDRSVVVVKWSGKVEEHTWTRGVRLIILYKPRAG